MALSPLVMKSDQGQVRRVFKHERLPNDFGKVADRRGRCQANLMDRSQTELERLKAEAPKGGRPKAEEKPQQKIVEVLKPQERQTDHKIAEAIGTNRTYVNDARKVYEKRPDLHEKVKAGKLTLPQAKTEIKREEKRRPLQAAASAGDSNNLSTRDCPHF